jgi:hypothetical protein
MQEVRISVLQEVRPPIKTMGICIVRLGLKGAIGGR